MKSKCLHYPEVLHYFLNKTHDSTVHSHLEQDFAFSAAENH